MNRIGKFAGGVLLLFVVALSALAELRASGELSPVIDCRYALGEIADAVRYSEPRRARGKIVMGG
jgi:NADPH:quinone reductase-like Zn-dependent oxidoreductase